MDRPQVSRSGFTLAEVMIAVFIFSLLGVAIVSFDFLAQGVFRRAGHRVWLHQEPRRLIDFMMEDLALAESILIYNNTGDGDGLPENGGTPLTTGNTADLQYYKDDDNSSPSTRSDDDFHEIRYTWTTRNTAGPSGSPGAWTPSLTALVRRYERINGAWFNNDIVCGLTKDAVPGAPNPDTVVLPVTDFRVTQQTNPLASNFAGAEPQNVIEVVVEVSRQNERHRGLYLLQSRSLQAEHRFRKFLLAFLNFLKRSSP